MDGRTKGPGGDEARERGARRGPDVTGLALAVLLIGAGATGGLCRRVWAPARGAPGSAASPSPIVDPAPGPSAVDARRPRPRVRAGAAAPVAREGARRPDAGPRLERRATRTVPPR